MDAAPNHDELVALGLLDPTAVDADDREALLRFLLARGTALADLERSRDLARLVGASVDELVRPGPRLSRREVAWRTGIDDDVLVRMRQAAGLSDPGIDVPCCTEADVVAARAFERLALLFGEAVALQLLRVVGTALARIAEAALSAFAVEVAAPLRELGRASGSVTASASSAYIGSGVSGVTRVDGVDLVTARAFTEVAAALPDLGRALDSLLRHHLEAAMHELDATRRGPIGSDVVTVTVGFLDLVDSTSWARARSVHDLASGLGRFAQLANAVAARHRARIVKVIGDEVMLVARDGAAGCACALELVEECARDGVLPALRGGLATGDVVARDGDYHGEVVHLASRLVKEADPHAIIVDADTRSRARAHPARASGLAFHSVGLRYLRGFDEPIELVGVTRRGARAAVA
jgi:class 3 adenylate cyclase